MFNCVCVPRGRGGDSDFPEPSVRQQSAIDGLRKQLERSSKGSPEELSNDVMAAFEMKDMRGKGLVNSRDFGTCLKSLGVRLLSRDEKMITDYLDGLKGAQPGMVNYKTLVAVLFPPSGGGRSKSRSKSPSRRRGEDASDSAASASDAGRGGVSGPEPSAREKAALDGLRKQLERGCKGSLDDLPDDVTAAFENLDSRGKGQVGTRDFQGAMKSLGVRMLSRDERLVVQYLEGMRGAEPGMVNYKNLVGVLFPTSGGGGGSRGSKSRSKSPSRRVDYSDANGDSSVNEDRYVICWIFYLMLL